MKFKYKVGERVRWALKEDEFDCWNGVANLHKSKIVITERLNRFDFAGNSRTTSAFLGMEVPGYSVRIDDTIFTFFVKEASLAKFGLPTAKEIFGL